MDPYDGNAVWAKMKGFKAWPALCAPDPAEFMCPPNPKKKASLRFGMKNLKICAKEYFFVRHSRIRRQK
jgi:hypothetical protein